MPAESTFTAATERCPHPEWWHSPDTDSTEREVSELVGAFVRALQPDLVVETGTCYGYTTRHIGAALIRNGHGRCVSLEIDGQRVAVARERCAGLPVEVRQTASLDYTPDSPVGFAFFDSLTHLRGPEFEHLYPHLVRGTIVGFHDTAPHHRIVAEAVEALAARGLLRPIFLPTPRGVAFAQAL